MHRAERELERAGVGARAADEAARVHEDGVRHAALLRELLGAHATPRAGQWESTSESSQWLSTVVRFVVEAEAEAGAEEDVAEYAVVGTASRTSVRQRTPPARATRSRRRRRARDTGSRAARRRRAGGARPPRRAGAPSRDTRR